MKHFSFKGKNILKLEQCGNIYLLVSHDPFIFHLQIPTVILKRYSVKENVFQTNYDSGDMTKRKRN